MQRRRPRRITLQAKQLSRGRGTCSGQVAARAGDPIASAPVLRKDGVNSRAQGLGGVAKARERKGGGSTNESAPPPREGV
jgi:hypothetical protein